MRELLFRGFHPCEDGKETIWIDGKEIKGYWVLADSIIRQNNNDKIFLWGRKIEDVSDGTKVMAGHLVEVIPETVGQYISLTDKIGTGIFEGDILRTCLHPEICTGVVEYKSDIGCYIVKLIDGENTMLTFLDYQITKSNVGNLVWLEVIGDKWSNPELMEVSSKC